MEKITPQQVTELANCFLAMGKTLGDFRHQNFDRLSKQQNEQLENLTIQILNFANDKFTLSSVLVMDDINTALDSINTLTSQMNSTINKLKEIQNVIDLATSIVNLGNAILDKDPGAILAILEKLNKKSGV